MDNILLGIRKIIASCDNFSEDIDLVVVRRENETDNRLKSKLKSIEKVINTTLPEIEIEGLTHKVGMSRKTAHSYNKEFTGAYGQIRDVIVIESTWLGYCEPYTTRTISSFLGNMMIHSAEKELAEKFDMLPFSVQVLKPTRTICEKIMSLVRFSYAAHPIDDLRNKIRHTYDLHQLLQQKEFAEFFDSSDFDKMLLRVANDDVKSFRNNNYWLGHHPNKSMLFNDLSGVWRELEATYSGSFRDLGYGDFPKSESVLATLEKIRERMRKIEWTITP